MDNFMQPTDGSDVYQYTVQEEYDAFKGPQAIFIDADGNEVVYEYEEVANISVDAVAGEEVVYGETVACEDLTWQPSTSRGMTVNSSKYARIAQPTVLLSAKSLEVAPNHTNKRRRNDSFDMVNLREGSLNKNIPLMKNMFKNVEEATLEEIDHSIGVKKKKHEIFPIFSEKALEFGQISEILLGVRDVKASSVCFNVPQKLVKECSFVVKVDAQANLEDDGVGLWGKYHVKYFSYRDNQDGTVVRIVNNEENGYDYRICMKRYCHPASKAANEKDKKFGFFVKKIFTMERKDELSVPLKILAIITYAWQNGEPFDFLADWDPTVNIQATCTVTCLEQPVYSFEAIDTEQAIQIVLGGLQVPPEKIASTVPQRFTSTGTFVIDLSKLKHPNEVRIDGNGHWSKPHGKAWYYNVCPSTGKAIRIEGHCKTPETSLQYELKVTLRRHENKDAQEQFVRKIFTARNSQGGFSFEGNPFLAVLVYSWRDEPFHFEPSIRQNAVCATLEPRTDEFVDEKQGEEEDFSEAQSSRDPHSESSKKTTKTRLMVLKKQWENQQRISQVLDRSEAFLTRVEDEFAHATTEFVEVFPVEEQIWETDPIIEPQQILEQVIQHN